MDRITLDWLLGILRAVPRQDRQHGPALEVVRAVFEQQNAEINLWFGAMVTLIAPILVAALGVLVSDFHGSAEAGFRFRDALLSAAVTAGVVVMGMVGLAQRLLRKRATLGYTRAVALYFFLHNVEP